MAIYQARVPLPWTVRDLLGYGHFITGMSTLAIALDERTCSLMTRLHSIQENMERLGFLAQDKYGNGIKLRLVKFISEKIASLAAMASLLTIRLLEMKERNLLLI